jgi:fibronectin type 3 domain-containing protein
MIGTPHCRQPRRAIWLFCCLLLLVLAGCGTKPIADTPPSARVVSTHSVTIRWTASKTKVAGYNVYRLSPSDLTVKLTHEIVLGTEYTDSTAEAGHTYSYFVTAVDGKGRESSPSEKVDVKVPAATVHASPPNAAASPATQ